MLTQGYNGPSFEEKSNRHAAFTTLLRLDASFTMAPCVLRHHHLPAPDVPRVLRPKPSKSSISAWPPHDLLDFDAYPASAKPLTPPSYLIRPISSSSDMYSCSLGMWIVHHSTQTPRVPPSKSTRIHPSPSLVHQYQPFA